MADVVDVVRGKIVDYDERTHELHIVATYEDFATLCRREYSNVEVRMVDGRRLSNQQRRMCYALIRSIADWMGDIPSETKELLKLEFVRTELLDCMDTFSLSNAPMSLVAAFQSWLVRFIVRNDIPVKKPLLTFVDDIEDYVYACLASKKCAICGQRADLHHIDRIGMGRDRTDVIHEGLEVLPLCRTHHTEAHGMTDSEFFERYHLDGGVKADKTICKIYGLKVKK